MTLDQAIVIRQLQLCGKAVGPELLAEAIEVIQRTRTPTKAARAGQKRPSAQKAIAGKVLSA